MIILAFVNLILAVIVNVWLSIASGNNMDKAYAAIFLNEDIFNEYLKKAEKLAKISSVCFWWLILSGFLPLVFVLIDIFTK